MSLSLQDLIKQDKMTYFQIDLLIGEIHDDFSNERAALQAKHWKVFIAAVSSTLIAAGTGIAFAVTGIAGLGITALVSAVAALALFGWDYSMYKKYKNLQDKPYELVDAALHRGQTIFRRWDTTGKHVMMNLPNLFLVLGILDDSHIKRAVKALRELSTKHSGMGSFSKIESYLVGLNNSNEKVCNALTHHIHHHRNPQLMSNGMTKEPAFDKIIEAWNTKETLETIDQVILRTPR